MNIEITLHDYIAGAGLVNPDSGDGLAYTLCLHPRRKPGAQDNTEDVHLTLRMDHTTYKDLINCLINLSDIPVPDNWELEELNHGTEED